jgi:TBPIP/Hop2 winged helix domain
MDELTTEQILTCKEYGKAKIYLVNQDLFPETSPDELLQLDEQIKERKDEFDGLATSLKQLNSSLKEANGGMTNTELEAEIA